MAVLVSLLAEDAGVEVYSLSTESWTGSQTLNNVACMENWTMHLGRVTGVLLCFTETTVTVLHTLNQYTNTFFSISTLVVQIFVSLKCYCTVSVCLLSCFFSKHKSEWEVWWDHCTGGFSLCQQWFEKTG